MPIFLLSSADIRQTLGMSQSHPRLRCRLHWGRHRSWRHQMICPRGCLLGFSHSSTLCSVLCSWQSQVPYLWRFSLCHYSCLRYCVKSFSSILVWSFSGWFSCQQICSLLSTCVTWLTFSWNCSLRHQRPCFCAFRCDLDSSSALNALTCLCVLTYESYATLSRRSFCSVSCFLSLHVAYLAILEASIRCPWSW